MKTLEQIIQNADAIIERITPEEVMNDNKEYLVIDVREAEELQSGGKIENAINIPRGLLEFKLKPSKNLNEDAPILVYCAAGLRAALAGQTLKELGFKNVKNLGGFDDWVKAGGKIDT
tara:strand:- start:307 stop:660 length:354 start_codon:yes stop_codon:yes gene_type:complete